MVINSLILYIVCIQHVTFVKIAVSILPFILDISYHCKVNIDGSGFRQFFLLRL